MNAGERYEIGQFISCKKNWELIRCESLFIHNSSTGQSASGHELKGGRMIKNQPLKNAWLLLACFLFCGLCPQPALAQDHAHGSHNHEHVNEVGLSAGYVYLEHDGEDAFGLHLHYMRRLQGDGLRRFFGLGVGFETIFADHMHYGILASLAVYPWRNLVLTLSPGLVFAEHEDEWETNLAAHIEATYGFRFGEFEIGPNIGFAQSGEDRHYLVGIHIGRGF
jgi:hypothetical protein